MAGTTGTWAEEKYEVISENTELHVGDIVDLDFMMASLFDWQIWEAVQLAAIEQRFAKDDRFTLLRHSYPENNVVTFRVRVDKNPIALLVLIAFIAACAVGTAVFVWLQFREARRITQGVVEAGGGVAATTLSLGMLAAIVVAGMIAFRWLRRRK